MRRPSEQDWSVLVLHRWIVQVYLCRGCDEERSCESPLFDVSSLFAADFSSSSPSFRARQPKGYLEAVEKRMLRLEALVEKVRRFFLELSQATTPVADHPFLSSLRPRLSFTFSSHLEETSPLSSELEYQLGIPSI